jgi:hypothetical protein
MDQQNINKDARRSTLVDRELELNNNVVLKINFKTECSFCLTQDYFGLIRGLKLQTSETC